MKTAIVPAQITTVEDKVAGNLSLSQMLLLATPIFGGTAIYIVVPPTLEASPFKIALIVLIAIMFGLFAIRIKGQILLLWAVILIRYNLRPRYYISDKNDLYLRPVPKNVPVLESTSQEVSSAEEQPMPEPMLDLLDVVKLQQIIANPDANLHFTTDRKGALRVNITEVK